MGTFSIFMWWVIALLDVVIRTRRDGGWAKDIAMGGETISEYGTDTFMAVWVCGDKSAETHVLKHFNDVQMATRSK